MSDERIREALEPLRKSITVPWGVEAAFRRFTAEMAKWWPLRSHSVAGEKALSCVFEGHVGGKIYEVSRDGGRFEWGTVLAWEPPHRVEFTWHPGENSSTAQRVELRFSAAADGTRLDLTQSGWENSGRDPKRLRRAYGIGWAYVLRIWAGQRRAPIVLLVDVMVAAIRPLVRLRRRISASPATSEASRA